ncbi:uncharacterized protein LOC101897815 [Musca domestica]|uniref:Uncharacterized protein LOC101897815 n=1 Tax=Musca domestica TaxID=7370 RepID=A0A1I8MXY6_MUSDO|nr:uncharacterized protein LOC101897815 [Musca domestica]
MGLRTSFGNCIGWINIYWWGFIAINISFFLLIIAMKQMFITKESFEEEDAIAFTWFCSVAFAVCVLIITVSALLVRGIKEKRPKAMIPFLLFTFTQIIAYLCGAIVISLSYADNTVLFVLVVNMVIQSAIFIPIFSLYRTMQKKRFHNPADNTKNANSI